MQKTVFVLGAGASFESGAPLMSTFLDRARDLLVAGKVADAKNDFENVFHALVRLRDVFFKSGLDLDNIESVFGAFEIARIIGRLGDYSPEQIEDLEKSMRTLIVRTLDESIEYRYHHVQRQVNLRGGYDQFVRLIKAFSQGRDDGSACSILTFNYDVALDDALTKAGVPYDYWLGPSTNKSALKLMKLHGSLNWSKCPKCTKIKAVSPIKAMQASKEKILQLPSHGEVSSFTLPAATMIAEGKCDECNTLLANDPVIVPPTWNKGGGHREVASVWRQAAIELGEAENIICMGYSLPESDLFFRYLFALGTVGEAHLRRFWVFDPDPKSDSMHSPDALGPVEKRYRVLIGKGIEHRFKFFRDDAGKFSNAVRKEGDLWWALVQ